MSDLQLVSLHNKYDELQKIYGAPELNSIYGAGDTKSTKYLFVFMNPTKRNVASEKTWEGLRAQWLGTKTVWSLFKEIGIISDSIYKDIQSKRPADWTPSFSMELYKEIDSNNAFITNLAKCTQVDARPLPNSVFNQYRDLLLEEVRLLNNPKVILFGNQVSSIVLGKNLSVSNYLGAEFEQLEILPNTEFYPTYYPVGQGRRNMPLAVSRLELILT